MSSSVVKNQETWEKEYQILLDFFCGNRESIDTLYQSMYPSLKNFLRGFQGSSYLKEEDLDDLVSLTLSTSIENFSKYDCTRASYKTWVYAIGKNLKRNAVKDVQKKVLQHKEFDDCRYYQVNGSPDPTDPLDWLIKEELFNAVWTAFGHLTSSEQTLLLQKIEERKTFQELSKIYQVSISTIFKRYHLTVRLLRYQFLRIYYRIC